MGIGRSQIGYILIHISTKFAKIANIQFQNGDITCPFLILHGIYSNINSNLAAPDLVAACLSSFGIVSTFLRVWK